MTQSPTGDYGKPTTGMRQLGTSLEPDTLVLGVERTPTELFFVCSASDAPQIETDDWRLKISGDAIEREITIDHAELLAMPQRSVDAWLECAGNGRAMFSVAAGHTASSAMEDTAWTLGAMGMATWTGVPLRDVLELAGIGEAAAWVGVQGADVDNTEGEAAAMCLPLEKALDDDTLLAITMNDEPLLPAHGYPVRLLVPGWVGAYSVKWLRRIEVSTAWVPSWRADVYYRRRLADGTDLGPATSHPVKSCLALDWPAALAAGNQVIRGYARCGDHRVARVEVSIDTGPWFDVPIVADLGRWGWYPFEFAWNAGPGEHHIRTRAWDSDGNGQPESIDYCPNTILWNAVTAHPVVVG